MLITFTTANPLLIILSQEQINADNDEIMEYEEENLLRGNGENEADDNEESICPGQEGCKRIVGLSLIQQARPRTGRAGSLTHQPPGPLTDSLKLSPCILTCTSSPHPTSLPPSSTTTTAIPTSLYSSSALPHSFSTLNSSYTTTNPSSSNCTDSSPPSTPSTSLQLIYMKKFPPVTNHSSIIHLAPLSSKPLPVMAPFHLSQDSLSHQTHMRDSPGPVLGNWMMLLLNSEQQYAKYMLTTIRDWLKWNKPK